MTVPSSAAAPRVAYVMSRFPKLSETFILYEILALERRGVRVEIFPLVREREATQHEEAERLATGAHHSRFWSRATLAAQWYWLRRRPRSYVGAWARAVIGNLSSPRFFLRAIVVVPLAAGMARRMEGLGVEHIHAHWATHPTLAAYVASRLTGIGYSFTAHAHDLYVDRTMLLEKVERARFVVTISEYNRRLLTSLYGDRVRHKLEVIHCGTDPAVFVPPQSPRDSANTWVLVCIASLQPQKGHLYLIEACRQLTDDGLALRCMLIGEGEERAAVERQISQSGLSGTVILAGSQPRHRVVELLAASDVVVHPSITLANGKTEGIPVALMEALSMERPVVATDISGVPELIQNGVTGLLVPERDSRALAGALRTLYDDRALAAALGHAGRKLVVDEFNLHASAERLEELFAAASTRHL